MRVAALWFPDWPVQAAGLYHQPAAVAAQHRVAVCNESARRAGVRRDMRVRQAQAVCPELVMIDNNPDRDGAVFAALAAGLDDVASSVEVLRPGLAVVDVAAAGRFHGGEDVAVEKIIDAAARQGTDMTIGVADELATACIAARHRGTGTIVKAGGSREFLAGQPTKALATEVGPELIAHFERLGIHRLGELAALPLSQVATRFGEPGRRAHSIARAATDRRVAPELPASELAVSIAPEEAIERVDAAAFAARQLAADLHQRLVELGVVCLRLRVRAELSDGSCLERVWRTRDALSEAATADRVRWQLDGWLRTRHNEAGIVELILDPLETAAPGPVGYLWDNGGDKEAATRVITRVQSTLGFDRVLQPCLAGGRGVAERIEMIPYGEQRADAPQGSWPGQIPMPLPAQLGHPVARVRLIDAAAKDIIVTAEALLSSVPVALGWGSQRYHVVAWAGPWPVDTLWWTPNPQRVARLQVVGQAADEDKQRAWLLAWSAGRWSVEAIY